ncbi:hypothetical protein ACFC0S_17085 [Streptomyces sp. NPDC056084]|uniref:hypothetical protein n=1 Tax=unclassified Streptomyces TaxID=2593676 RepID=UPI0035DFD16D
MSAFTIAEARSRKSESPAAFMANFIKGRAFAESGEEPRLDGKTAAQIAGLIEGLASWRAQTAKPRDYMGHASKRRAVAS